MGRMRCISNPPETVSEVQRYDGSEAGPDAQ